MKHNTLVMLAAVALVFILIFAALLYHDNRQKIDPRTSFSLVVYGTDADRWHPLELGAQQACSELGLIKPTMVLTAADTETQMRQLAREQAGGAQGVLVAVPNSTAMQQPLAAFAAEIPVVAVVSASPGIPAVVADSAAMGDMLAERVAADGCRQVLLVLLDEQADSVTAVRDGFLQAGAAYGLAVETYPAKALPGRQMLEQYDAVVALSPETMTQVLDRYADGMPRGVALYGFGCTPRIADAMGKGRVQALCFADEYSMGYIGIMRLAKQAGLPVPAVPDTIPCHLADAANMYQPEIARLLFPDTLQ